MKPTRYATFIAPVISQMAAAREQIEDLSVAEHAIPGPADVDALESLKKEAFEIMSTYSEACIRGCGYSIFNAALDVQNIELKVSQEGDSHPSIQIIPVTKDGKISEICTIDPDKIILTEEVMNEFATSSMTPDVIFSLFDGYSVNRSGIISKPKNKTKKLTA